MLNRFKNWIRGVGKWVMILLLGATSVVVAPAILGEPPMQVVEITQAEYEALGMKDAGQPTVPNGFLWSHSYSSNRLNGNGDYAIEGNNVRVRRDGIDHFFPRGQLVNGVIVGVASPSFQGMVLNNRSNATKYYNVFVKP